MILYSNPPFCEDEWGDDGDDGLHEATILPFPPKGNGKDGKDGTPKKDRRQATGASAGREVRRTSWRQQRAATGKLLHRLQVLRGKLETVVLKGTAFRASQASQLIAAIDREIDDATRDLAMLARNELRTAADLGVSHVDETIIGAQLKPLVTAGVTTELVTTAADVTADLLRDPMQQFRRRIVNQVRRLTVQGANFADEWTALAKTLSAEGFSAPEFQAERVLRTEMSRVFNQATHDRIVAQAASMPYLRKGWIRVLDQRTRETHKIAGERYARGKGIEVTDYFSVGKARMRFPVDPLAEPGGKIAAGETIMCFVGDTRISGNVTAGMRAMYRGPVVSLVTASGRRLTVTPNHPILTSCGWIQSGRVELGFDVFSDRGWDERDASKRAGDDADGEPAIAEVVRAMEDAGTILARPRTALDFDGDGECIEGDVYVVASDGALRRTGDADGQERAHGVHLPCADLRERPLASNGHLGHHGFRPGGGGGAPRGAALANHSAAVGLECLPLQDLSLRSPANRDAVGPKDLCDYRPAPSEHGSDTLTGRASAVSHDNVGCDGTCSGGSTSSGARDPLAVGSRAHLCAALHNVLPHRDAVDPEVLGERIDRGASFIARDRVVELKWAQFHGWVYDVEAVEGMILAGGIVASNCRCSAFLEFDLAGIRQATAARVSAAMSGRTGNI